MHSILSISMFMKKIFYLAALVVLLAACNENTPETPAQTVSFAQAALFEAMGANTVPNVDGELHDQAFVKDSVRVEAKIVSDSTLDIYLYGINFSSRMPMTIDMVIPAAQYERTTEHITFFGDSIVPMMGGNPFAKYIITGLSGTISADSLVFTNNYGTYLDCSYAGMITKLAE